MTTSFLAKTASRRSGYSLIEVLMVVAIMSTISAGALFGVRNVLAGSENTKLQRDVGVVNTAIRAYLLNGGRFLQSDLQNPATVLSKLKRRASASSAREIAGLRGSMVDERLSYEMQSSEEAAQGAPRARFISDPLNPRFIIQIAGPPGIRRFVFDSSLAASDFGTEDRTANLKLAKKDPWVWDYSDGDTSRDYPSLPPSRDPTTGNQNPPDVGNKVLNAPAFSLAGGVMPLWTYPRTLALNPTNPAGTAQIVYSINGGPFLPYSGPMNVDPGMVVTGVSASLDTDRYDDSPSASRSYQTTPETPWPFVFFRKASYNFFELGGESAAGTPPPLPSGSVTGTGVIMNIIFIPMPYQNSSVFRYVWTTDGTNPLTSGTASRQPDFRGGFISAAIPVGLEAFGSGNSVTVLSAVKAENPAVVNDSAIVSRTLNADVLPLRVPLITVDGRDVTLALDVSQRDMPKGARIYYTVDGADPGVDASGNPLRGTLYSGVPFTLTGLMGGSATVRARTYVPAKFRPFFTTSPVATLSLVLPASTAVYVGGNFVNGAGNPMRNIALLNNSGQVDIRFDTGRGAADDSLIGIVRQSAAGVMAGGDFETMDGAARQGLVRLRASGAVDVSFDADLSSN